MPELIRKIDHLVYVAQDLETAIEEIGGNLGVVPVKGGKHPEFGTHNAQVKLGAATYLEIIAPDPEAESKAPSDLFGVRENGRDKLVTWVMNTDDIDGLAASARKNGFDPGKIAPAERVTPHGDRLTWKLSNPFLMACNGAVPFLIDWGNTSQPATTLPDGVKLIGLRIIHPEPNVVVKNLSALGVEMAVDQGTDYELIATIQTSDGIFELR